MKTCADCGAALVQADPRPRPAPGPGPLAGRLKRQLWATAGLSAALIALAYLPLPASLVDPDAIAGQLGIYSSWAPPSTGLLSLGPTPFLIGFALTELFALIVPRLRRRRLSDLRLRRTLWRASLIVGGVMAFLQGLGLAISFESLGYQTGGMGGYGPPAVPDPGWAFRLTCACLLAGGAGVFAAFAWAVDRVGLGRGFGLAILVSMILGLPGGAAVTYRAVAVDMVSPVGLALLAAGVAGTLWLMNLLWRRSERWLAEQPLRLPTCGLLPLDLALLFVALPSLLASFFWFGPFVRLSELLVPGSNAHLIAVLAISAALVLPASTLFYWRQRQTLTSGPEAGRWRLAMALSGAVLAALVIADHLILRFAPSLFEHWPGILTLVVLWALAGDWLAEFGARRLAGGRPLQVLEVHQDLSDALASLQVYRQLQPDHRFFLTGTRYRALTYVFGPYVPLLILGPPEARARAVFSGGETLQAAQVAEQFE